MTTSLIAALGAMRAHQAWLDVIGNNLANSNTPGFKSSRVLFSDILSVTTRPATGPTAALGGTNPLQKGIGAQLAAVDRSFEQGALTATGRTLDLALQGRGFFALTDGDQTLYTRVGTFGLDGNGNMVDLRSGLFVLNSSGSPFQIDTKSVLPPQATTQVGFSGNLPAEVTGPLAEELTTSSGLSEGTAASMSGTASEPFNIPVGETWSMEIAVDGGAPQTVAIPGRAAAYSAQEIVDEINLQTQDLVASVGGSGEVVLASQRTGESSTIQVTAGPLGADLQGLLGLPGSVQGSQSVALPTTDLNDLTSNVTDYAPGDRISISGTDVDGTPILANFVYGTDGQTVADLVAFIDAQFSQATASFDATTGNISLLADSAGEAELSLSITDGSGQAGSTNWSESFFTVTTDGTGPDTVTSSVEIFDANGTAHILTFDYTRQEDGSWNLDVSVPATEGTVTQGTIAGITFNDNGSILTPTSGQIEVQFGGLSPQTIALDFGTSGQFGGLTQFGAPAGVVADFQDGSAPGELVNMQVRKDGTIEGFFTNGQTQTLGNFGVAVFPNEAALEDVGNGFMSQTPNTGVRVLGAGNASGAGQVIGGSLEDSNVDTAVQFVNLIEAQRGFQANARIISVQDDLLAEVVNVI